MTVFSKILCPVQFEQNSIEALKFAARIAASGDVILYLLHVISGPMADSISMQPPPAEVIASTRRELETLGHKHVPAANRREIIVRVGDPPQIIDAVAGEFAVDLIVMATHGHKGVARLLLGSVAEKVVRTSAHPVLTIRPIRTAQPASA
jgi:nucleotide-binding universal stress UspA family protein